MSIGCSRPFERAAGNYRPNTTSCDVAPRAPPGLSVVCFRFLDPSSPDEESQASLNRRLLERLQLGGEAFLTSTELGGRFVLRACIVNHRSTRDDIDRMLHAVRVIGRDLVAVSAR